MGLNITTSGDERFLEIATDTEVVTPAFLNELIDEITGFIDKKPFEHFKILLTVKSPKADFTIMDSYQVWQRAYKKGIGRTQIAYVIDGRPASPLAKFVEAIAQNRHIQLQFFE